MAKPANPPGTQLVASNRQARRDYDILDTVEAGMVLSGSEVKALREAKVQLSDAYARIIDHEAWIIGLHISPKGRGGQAPIEGSLYAWAAERFGK
mgnify:CR=1 FL=1